jgi:mono/diheme cytochrome c family protein
MSRGSLLPKPRSNVVIAVLVAAALGGCGSGSAQVSGPAVFAAHCAICHSISGSPAPEQQGGDLGQEHLPRSQLVQFTVEMPVVHRSLTSAELRAVVGYLQKAQRR